MEEKKEINSIYIKKEPGKLYKLLDCASPLLIYLAVNVIISAALGAAVLIMSFLSAGKLSAPEIVGGQNATMILSLLMDVILIIVMYFIYRHDKKSCGMPYGIKNEPRIRWLIVALVIIMGLGLSIFANMGGSLIHIQEFMEKYAPERLELFGNDPVIEFITLCIGAPVAEELIFRAGIFGKMRKYTSFLPAALVSAAIFGIVHLEIFTGIVAFFMGIILAWLYEKTGSIFATMLFHFGFNFYPTVVDIYANVTGIAEQEVEEVVSQGAVNAVLVGYLVVAALMFVIPFIMIKRRSRQQLLIN